MTTIRADAKLPLKRTEKGPLLGCVLARCLSRGDSTANRNSENRFIEVLFDRKAAINYEAGYGAAAATLSGHWSSVGCQVLSGL